MIRDILDPRLRAAIRTACSVDNNAVPITITPGKDSLTVTGEIGGHFTRGGDSIAYPSAYGRFGWSNMVYRTDSRRITLGLETLGEFIKTEKPYTS